MKRFLKALGAVLLRPFSTEIVYTLVLWVVACGYFVFRQLMMGNLYYCGYLALVAYVVAVGLSFVVNANKYLAYVLIPLVLLVLLLLFITDMFYVTNFSTRLPPDFVLIVGNTNMEEIREFFSVFARWYHIAIIVMVVLALYIVIYKVKWTLRGKWLSLPIVFLLLAALATCHNPQVIKDELAYDALKGLKFEEIVDLRQHLTHPVVVETDSVHPKNIVVVLGESFAKKHSSLYGYEKCTNPLLAEFVERGNMVVFDEPTSPCFNTTLTFKYILNTHVLSDNEEKKWYEYTNIIETYKTVGYRTFWISNQEEQGLWGNLPSGHSKICNLARFNQADSRKFDDYLIGALTNSELATRNCIFYHLMGQHFAFESRFPKDFAKFNADDYKDKAQHQRQTLADYDNATLYNDYVVSEIIKKYADKDAIVFYFSDHGQDLFVTDPNHAAHAKQTPESQKVGKEIPFMVYISDSLQQRNPTLKAEVKKLAKKPFCTDHFIFLALQLTGYALK